MAQRLRALTTVREGPEFKCQQPHGGTQPSLMGSDGVFEDSYHVLIYIKEINLKKNVNSQKMMKLGSQRRR